MRIIPTSRIFSSTGRHRRAEVAPFVRRLQDAPSKKAEKPDFQGHRGLGRSETTLMSCQEQQLEGTATRAKKVAIQRGLTSSACWNYAKQGHTRLNFRPYDYDWDSEAYFPRFRFEELNQLHRVTGCLLKALRRRDWGMLDRTTAKSPKGTLRGAF